jgi:hypothetical protein
MPQDPNDFRNEEDFIRAQYLNPKIKSVNVPKPNGTDRRVYAINRAGHFKAFPNMEAAHAELQRLKQWDLEQPGMDRTSAALIDRDAWAIPANEGSAEFQKENKDARGMGFSSVLDDINSIKKGMERYRGKLEAKVTAKSYPSQGKMSKLMEDDLKKKGR